jgi:hypothetical protein
VAAVADGVHFTLRAVTALHAVWLDTGDGLIAAPYWAAESTFWLRWRFAGVAPIDTGSVGER